MSTSPIRTVFETSAPTDLVNIQRPTAGGFSAIDASVPLESMLSSGSYEPTISAETNGIVVTPNPTTFVKVGSRVTCFALLEVTLDTGETTGSFEISLPFASTFTNPKQCTGFMQYKVMSELVFGDITAETTNNTCSIILEVASAELNMSYLIIQFQYEIL